LSRQEQSWAQPVVTQAAGLAAVILEEAWAMDELGKNRSLHADAKSRPGGLSRDDKQKRDEQRREHLDDALDVALEETFPGSDPVSIVQPPANVHEKNELQRR
jgi:hypothetical protein